MRRALFIIRLIVAAALLSLGVLGCGGGGFDPAPDIAAINELIARFEQGVEAYDIDLMTGDLDELSFGLTLQEGAGGTPYPDPAKSYTTLLGELTDEENNQLYWRQEEPYNYRLDLVLAGVTVDVPGPGTIAAAAASFDVVESATGVGISAVTTDTGTISWILAKTGEDWTVVSMAIVFDAIRSLDRAVSGGFDLPGSPFIHR